MNKNKNGFAMIFGISVILLTSIMMLYIANIIGAFMRNMQGADNFVKAYYDSYAGIEKGIYKVNKENIGSNINLGSNIIVQNRTTTIPEVGKGNSDYNNNFNRIKIGEPIRIYITNNNINWENANTFLFKVPTIRGNGGANQVLLAGLSNITDMVNSKLISWSIVSGSDFINAYQNGIIQGGAIRSSESNASYSLSTRRGIKRDGTLSTFGNFISTCSSTNPCVLTFNLLENISPFPYLEYRINLVGTGFSDYSLPSNYVNIESTGIATNSAGTNLGYKRRLYTNYPNRFTNEAFDFALFR